MPANPDNHDETPDDSASAEKPEHELTPLERIRQAQAARSLPPGVGGRGGKGGGGRGTNPSAPKMYNRHK
jgi:hypothetical protein